MLKKGKSKHITIRTYKHARIKANVHSPRSMYVQTKKRRAPFHSVPRASFIFYAATMYLHNANAKIKRNETETLTHTHVHHMYAHTYAPQNKK